MRRSRWMTGLGVTALALSATTLAPQGAAAHENDDDRDLELVRVIDDCEPVSFTANIPIPDVCVGDGDTVFADFIDQLLATAPSGLPSVDDWEFKPSDVHIDSDEGLLAVNLGGEFHTFTPVDEFGGGCVGGDGPGEFPVLNGGAAKVGECTDPHWDNDPKTALLPGEELPVTEGLEPGKTQKYMCLIHPWMRTEVVVRAD